MTRELAGDLMASAVEGLSCFWQHEDDISSVEVKQTPAHGLSEEALDEPWYESITVTMTDGSEKRCSLDDMMKEENQVAFMTKYPHLPIDDNHDAESADAYLQFILFGDIIYG